MSELFVFKAAMMNNKIKQFSIELREAITQFINKPTQSAGAAIQLAVIK